MFGPPWVGDDDPLATLPKVSLHDHLDGSVRPATLIEIAVEQGTGDVLPSDDPDEVERWLRGDSEAGRPFGHEELFALLCSVMQTPETLRRVAAEYVATATADGVVYAESRWAPEKHQVRGMSLDDAVLAVAAGFEDGMAAAAAAGHHIVVRQLLCGMRNTARSTEIAELTVRHRGNGVVGYDLAGMEAGYPARDHVEAYRVIREANMAATCHTGEGDGVRSVWESVQLCHTLRLGHGTRLIEDVAIGGRAVEVGEAVKVWEEHDRGDVALGPVATYVRDHQLPLEQCPTSNSRWVVPGIEHHTVDMFKRLGFNVTVNPDNRMLSGTSVTGELRLLGDTFGWGIDDFRDVTVHAIEAAFVDLDTRAHLRDEIILPAYARASA